ncbi:hypothetical protein SE17_06110 [Kouleothrix aurantiaca]|uniref:Uncharacterized protein n=1 Tax=Kouleothrix aurantiaca TaxID=186479 RepID=A0A0P9D4M7_9CHLR|nr:hypothetical protein SE17_06110 [Kouleothrix aurantiaca]
MLALPIWVWPALVVISAVLAILFLKFGDGLLSSGFNGDIDDVEAISKTQSRYSSGSDKH